jgi:ribose transport system ATP-binding protein
VLKVEHLNAGRMVRDVSFELHQGEILGFSGLMGAGRTETARALFGADPKESGEITIKGKKVDIRTPEQAVAAGLGYLSEERKVTRKYVEALNTKTPGIDQLVVNLSGGNQQKVVIGKWLIGDSDILIFDEPTRGIDVGAKQEIYELMNQLVEQGKSIIMISSEMTEILRMSDRIIVMCEGRITGELGIEEATQARIMHFATLRS